MVHSSTGCYPGINPITFIIVIMSELDTRDCSGFVASPNKRTFGEFELGQLDQNEQQFLGSILRPSKARTATPTMTQSARKRFIKNKAQFYAQRTAQIVQDAIIHGHARFSQHPSDLSQILLHPQPQQPKRIMTLDPEEHRSIMQRLIKDHRRHQRRFKEKSMEIEMRVKEVEQRDREEEQARRDREVSERRERARERLRQLSELRTQRETNIKASNIEVSKIFNRSTLEDQYKDKYNRQFVLPAIAEQQKRLNKIKEEKAFPMDFEDIKKHERQYFSRKQEKALEKIQSKEMDTWSYQAPAYVPSSYQLIQQQQRKKELQRIEKIQKKFEANKNKQRLIGLLQEEFKERVRQNKARRHQKKQLQKLRTIETAPLNSQQIKQRGNSYLQFSKSRTSRKIGSPSPDPILPEDITVRRARMDIQQLEFSRFVRMRQHQRIRTMRVSNISQDMSLSPIDRERLLKHEAEKLDQLADRQDVLFQLKEPTQMEVDDAAAIVLASAKAKMAILKINEKSKTGYRRKNEK